VAYFDGADIDASEDQRPAGSTIADAGGLPQQHPISDLMSEGKTSAA
jgi:hypothetical protein